MTIRKYGIELIRLRKEHIELVREHRNSSIIRDQMFFQEEITPEMQAQWFHSISNIYNYYFLIKYKGSLIGLINGKKLDYLRRTSEGGIFVWDEQYRNSLIPVIATICMAELTFRLFHLERTYAAVKETNSNIIKYNATLGYELIRKEVEEGRQWLELTRENYALKGSRIRSAVMRLTKDESLISWDDCDFSDVTAEEKRDLYSNLPVYIQKEVDKRLPLHVKQ